MDKLEEFRDLLAEWLQKLGLHEWTVTADVTSELPDGLVAQVEPSLRRHHAYVRIRKDYLIEGEADELTDTAIHELLHVVLARPASLARRHAEFVGGRFEQAFWNEWNEAYEEAVDRLTAALLRLGMTASLDSRESKVASNDRELVAA